MPWESDPREGDPRLRGAAGDFAKPARGRLGAEPAACPVGISPLRPLPRDTAPRGRASLGRHHLQRGDDPLGHRLDEARVVVEYAELVDLGGPRSDLPPNRHAVHNALRYRSGRVIFAHATAVSRPPFLSST